MGFRLENTAIEFQYQKTKVGIYYFIFTKCSMIDTQGRETKCQHTLLWYSTTVMF